MLGKAIAELAPLGLAAALSPLPVIAVVLLLSAPAGPGAGVAFAGGWLAGLAGVTWALAFAAVEVEAVSLDLDAWTRVAIGLGLLAGGGWKWATRPRRDRVPKPPRWIASLAGVSRGTALLIGVVFGGPNPKNLALAFVAGATMAEYGLEGRGAFVAGLVFVLLGSVTVVGATLLRIAGGPRRVQRLVALKAFMLRHNNLVLMLVFVAIGLKILGDAIADLRG